VGGWLILFYLLCPSASARAAEGGRGGGGARDEQSSSSPAAPEDVLRSTLAASALHPSGRSYSRRPGRRRRMMESDGHGDDGGQGWGDLDSGKTPMNDWMEAGLRTVAAAGE
jgi:hypothetical protein